ncbi:glycosyltransferase [Aurantiacibacter aquimixticola]|uniref:Glycosyltransferase n=1 Tax=Aurantiacibacter aquimixticola TaxID=1958945 RepID=A0A419RSE0_9SPHN|nr:glycosyltransferase [Aurantiacibacter aquimixticola]RJY08723.1 glycosyltransferase [Aurantiacibacter aquimixticola]
MSNNKAIAVGLRRKSRIALIVTDAYAFNTLSRGQLEYFRDIGIDLDLFCYGTRKQLDLLRSRNVGRVIPVPFRRQPHPAMDLVALIVVLWHLLQRRYTSVVYSTPKAMLIGSIAAFMSFQARRICFVRGRAYETMKGRMRRIFLLMDRVSFRLSHEVIFLSRSLAQAYREDGVDLGERFRVLGHGSSNGVDLDRFRVLDEGQRAALRKTEGVSETDFVIVIAGRIVPDKGVHEALALIERLKDRSDLHWFFIGWPESDELTAAIKALAHYRVSHLDHSTDLQNWLGMADLSFLPSHREGFGNVGIEAAACGIPTLAFDVVGLRDSVAEGQTGTLVEFGDLEACEAFIRAAAADRADFASRYPATREWVAERFEKETVWRRYANAFLGVDIA